jgi:hypothetical protein
VGRERLRLQNWDSDSGETNANSTYDSRDEHLPVLERRSLDRSSDDDDEVCQYNRALPADLFTEYESNNSTESATNIVDSSDQPGHCGIWIAERIFEALAAENTTKESLVIFPDLLDRVETLKSTITYIRREENQDQKLRG